MFTDSLKFTRHHHVYRLYLEIFQVHHVQWKISMDVFFVNWSQPYETGMLSGIVLHLAPDKQIGGWLGVPPFHNLPKNAIFLFFSSPWGAVPEWSEIWNPEICKYLWVLSTLYWPFGFGAEGFYVPSKMLQNGFFFTHWEMLFQFAFLVAPCCSQGATLQVTLWCHPVVCPWQDLCPTPYP